MDHFIENKNQTCKISKNINQKIVLLDALIQERSITIYYFYKFILG